LLWTRNNRHALLVAGLVSVLATAAVAFVVPGAAATVTAHVTARADPASNLPYTYANFLDAVNAGRALEGLSPITDVDLGQFSVTQEMFVVINLERVDRGLPAFEEMTRNVASTIGGLPISLRLLNPQMETLKEVVVDR